MPGSKGRTLLFSVDTTPSQNGVGPTDNDRTTFNTVRSVEGSQRSARSTTVFEVRGSVNKLNTITWNFDELSIIYSHDYHTWVDAENSVDIFINWKCQHTIKKDERLWTSKSINFIVI